MGKKEVVLGKPFPRHISVLNMMKLCALYCTFVHGVVADEGLNLLQTMVHKHQANETLGPIRYFYGAVVSLCHPVHRKCIRMNGERVDTIPWTDNAGLPEEAKFTVVDGGLLSVAFWNARHQRYLRLAVEVVIFPPKEIRRVVSSPSKGMCELPVTWLQERFMIHEGGSGTVGLRCDFWGSFFANAAKWSFGWFRQVSHSAPWMEVGTIHTHPSHPTTDDPWHHSDTEKPCSQKLCAYECTGFCGCCPQCRWYRHRV